MPSFFNNFQGTPAQLAALRAGVKKQREAKAAQNAKALRARAAKFFVPLGKKESASEDVGDLAKGGTVKSGCGGAIRRAKGGSIRGVGCAQRGHGKGRMV